MKKIYFVIFLLASLILTGAGCIQFGGGAGATDGGIFKSADKAETWQQKVALAAVKPGSIADVNVVTMVFDPQDSQTIYLGTEENGLFYTADGAEAWLQVGAFQSGRINAVAVDAKDKCNVYVATGNKIFKTIDCTRSWQNIYVDPRSDQAVTSLAADFYNSSIIYAGMGGGEFLKSSDAGASWTAIKRFENKVVKILLAPEDSRIIYVALQNQGIWKSTDSGANWTSLNDGLNQFSGALDFKNLLIDPSQRDSLILVSKYGLLKTKDGGKTWQAINLLTPPGSVDIYSLAVNPKNSNEIYYGTSSTLYKSVNGGEKWITRKLPTSRAATYLLVDFKDPNVIYLGTTKINK
jgi:photosystem II stability/assembly factor-like uncharacterized protein